MLFLCSSLVELVTRIKLCSVGQFCDDLYHCPDDLLEDKKERLYQNCSMLYCVVDFVYSCYVFFSLVECFIVTARAVGSLQRPVLFRTVSCL